MPEPSEPDTTGGTSESLPTSPERPDRPGPIYDRFLRLLFETDLMGVCELLNVEPAVPPAVLPAVFTSRTRTADLLLSIGKRRLAHVEYVRRPTPDLVPRLLEYRSLIMLEHPGERLSQHVVVMGGGTVRGHTDLLGEGFALDLKLTYVREVDPAVLLSRPALAPLAVLARGNRDRRAASLAAALTVIHDRGGSRAKDLLEAATLLATIHLDVPIIRKIVKEAGVTHDELLAEIFFDTGPVQAIYKQALVELRPQALAEALVQVRPQALAEALVQVRPQALAEARAQVQTEARVQALAEARAEMLATLITDRFGDDERAAVIAQRLGRWANSSDAVHAVQRAASLDDLQAMAAPA